MEDNQINTMNLGNNIGGATPPVFSGTAVSQNTNDNSIVVGNVLENNETINANVATSVATNIADNNITLGDVSINQTQVQVQGEVSSTPPEDNVENIKEPIVLNGDITIPTILLREMVAQARKVGVSNNMQPLSEVLNLIVDENGITMITTSGKGKPDFICTDKKYVSTKKLFVSVDIKIFGDYLNAERNNTVTLEFVENENTLYITTDTGVRKFPQRVDGSTHQPIVHELQFPYRYEDMMAVNFERFLKLIELSRSARDLAGKLSTYTYLQGLYCGDDIVVASDGNVMTIQSNETEFKSEIFFLNNNMCDLITSIKFDPSKFRAGITKINGDVRGITLSDGRTTICGPLLLDPQFPVEAAKSFWNSTGFNQSIRFETRALADVLKSIVPFIPNMGDAVDKVTFDIKGDDVDIKSYDKTAKVVLTNETVKIINNTNYSTTTPIALPVSKLEKVLQSITVDNFDMLIDPTADNCVCLSYDGIRNIVTTLTDN